MRFVTHQKRGLSLFIGHTRFSLFDPNSGGWRASNGSRFSSVEEYQDYLFADERLDPRCEIFVNHSLPQIAMAAKDFDVAHVVSYSSHLPEKHQRILEEAAERFPFLVLDRCEGGTPTITPLTIARNEFRSVDRHAGDSPAFAIYRLDDDDLLPVDYFEQMSPYVRLENAGMMVSLGAGATALYINGEYYNVRQCYAPMIAIGLLSICQFQEDGTLIQPLGHAHNYSDRKNPVILDSRKTGFLWTRHASQDTSLGWGERATEEMHDVIRRYMDKHPAASMSDGFADAFPIIADKLFYQPEPLDGRVERFHEQLTLSRDPIRFEVADLEGSINISLDIRCSEGATNNNAIMTLELSVSNGGDLAELKLDARATGVALSTDPSIGYYAYIATEPGASNPRVSIRLPEGVKLKAFGVQRFRRHETKITVADIVVHEKAKRIVGAR